MRQPTTFLEVGHNPTAKTLQLDYYSDFTGSSTFLSCADMVEFSCTNFAEKFPSCKLDGNESCQTRENSIFLRYPGLVLDLMISPHTHHVNCHVTGTILHL